MIAFSHELNTRALFFSPASLEENGKNPRQKSFLYSSLEKIKYLQKYGINRT